MVGSNTGGDAELLFHIRTLPSREVVRTVFLDGKLTALTFSPRRQLKRNTASLFLKATHVGIVARELGGELEVAHGGVRTLLAGAA